MEAAVSLFGGERVLLWIIGGILVIILVIGAFKSDQPGCGCLILIAVLIFILWRTNTLQFAWYSLRYVTQQLFSWIGDKVFG
jgi:hypothetical protein